MASELKRVREEERRKAGVREKAYKEQIASLKAEIAEKDALLEDYDNMRRTSLKLAIYCGLDEKQKQSVMESKRIEDMLKPYEQLLSGLDGVAMSKVIGALVHGGKPLSDLLGGVGDDAHNGS